MSHRDDARDKAEHDYVQHGNKWACVSCGKYFLREMDALHHKFFEEAEASKPESFDDKAYNAGYFHGRNGLTSVSIDKVYMQGYEDGKGDRELEQL